MTSKEIDLSKSQYWADQAARTVISEWGAKDIFFISAGITPSGVVHIGNFREVITNDIVKRALEDMGHKVTFLYVWDNYDRFRKVPQGYPKQELLESCIGMPISDVPDTLGEYESYAERNEKEFEKDLYKVSIEPEFVYQSKRYKELYFKDDIRHAMINRKTIAKILDKHRKEPLADDWYPLNVYCKECNKDLTKIIGYNNEYVVEYHCKICNKDLQTDFSQEGLVNLKWRADWPMRWNKYDIHFEPGGKDHSTVGGSFDTAKEIVKELWDRNPPSYLMYDFVTLKGLGGKISSSKGNVIRLQDVLEIFTPEIVRFLFAGTRPGSEFSIPFDDNVLKVYEDFDAIERIYYGKTEVNDKDKANAIRIYEMSMISKEDIQNNMPMQPSFRQLAMLSQIYELDSESILSHFETDNEYDKKRIIARAECAFNWSRNYAPASWRYSKNERVPQNIGVIDDNSKKAFSIISEELYEGILEEDAGSIVKSAISESNVNTKEFFKLTYLLLINNEKGPRLSQILSSFPLYSKRILKEASK